MKSKAPSLEQILRIALAGRLPDLLEGRHDRYPTADGSQLEAHKVQILSQCDVLQKAGYLDIHIRYGPDGFPLPCYGDYTNVTIQGRDYLERIDQNKPWRRFIGWFIAFFLGLLSPIIADWLKILIQVYAKQHGLAE